MLVITISFHYRFVFEYHAPYFRRSADIYDIISRVIASLRPFETPACRRMLPHNTSQPTVTPPFTPARFADAYRLRSALRHTTRRDLPGWS
jgi:hypothetical protein